ncbi:hypothetical protein ACFQ9Z_13960 [Streptomyces sp. NPDC056580]|uniref:hypothetical protein n=1 Tax=Streptomyces sp. NPDC056580 TaxID=3345872 RepID=UPI0036752691
MTAEGVPQGPHGDPRRPRDVRHGDRLARVASIAHADDDAEKILLDAVRSLVNGADSIERQPPVHLPDPRALEPEQAVLPR